MGQPVSKRPATTAPIPPFENYHVYTGPPQQQLHGYGPDYPPPGRTEYGPPPGRPDYGPREPDYGPRPRPMERPYPRRPDFPPQGPPPRRPMDDDFWDEDGEDPVYLPEQAVPRLRGRPGGFDPFADGRRYPPQGPGGVSRQRGLAGDMIEGMRQQRIDPGRAQQYRTAPPPQQAYQSQAPYQPRITKYTSYVNEPSGYAPPPQQQSLAYQPPAQQQAPQQSSGTQPTVIYYDPETGNITGGNHAVQPAQQQQPQVISYPQGGQQPQMFSFPGQQPGQQQGFVLPQGLQGMMMMQQPAPAQQAQPIVIPGSWCSPTGQVHQLG